MDTPRYANLIDPYHPHDAAVNQAAADFNTALKSGVLNLQPITTTWIDDLNRAPEPVAHEPEIISGIEFEVSMARDSAPLALRQAELSPEAQAASDHTEQIAHPNNFAYYYDYLQSHDANNPKISFAWTFPYDRIYQRSRNTTAVYREPVADDASTTTDRFGLDDMIEAPHLGGSHHRTRAEISINVEPADAYRSLFNGAYARLESLLPSLYLKKGAYTREVRHGMVISDSEVLETSPLPAAALLQRSLLAYDAWQLTAMVDRQAAIDAYQAGTVPDIAYIKMLDQMVGIRPMTLSAATTDEVLAISEGDITDPIEDSTKHHQPIYTGIDVTALRCLAFGRSTQDRMHARTTVLRQASDTFGPEFLELLEIGYNAQATEVAQAEFVQTVATAMQYDRDNYHDHIKSPRVINRQEVPAFDDFIPKDDIEDRELYTYTTPYPCTADFVERKARQANPAFYNQRTDRIARLALQQQQIAAERAALDAPFRPE